MKETLEALLRESVKDLQRSSVIPTDRVPGKASSKATTDKATTNKTTANTTIARTTTGRTTTGKTTTVSTRASKTPNEVFGIDVRRTRDSVHGDFTTNLAMVLAPSLGMNSEELARELVERLPASDRIERVEIAGPGFINFSLVAAQLNGVISLIDEACDDFGHSDMGSGAKVLIECGPALLQVASTIGQLRTLANGVAIANILKAVGYDVHLRASSYRLEFDKFSDTRIAEITRDLAAFGITHDHWSITRRTRAVQVVVENLRKSGHIFPIDGTWRFNGGDFGDQTERVVVREGGQSTDYASDIAYLSEILDNGFERVLVLSGVDDQCFTEGLLAASVALGGGQCRIENLVIEEAHFQCSREHQPTADDFAGKPDTIFRICDYVGHDTARYFCIMRHYYQPLDFDLRLARTRTSANPVFNVQYAHARICSVVRQARDRGWGIDRVIEHGALSLLEESHEKELMTLLEEYPETVARAALDLAPNRISSYLQELANGLNNYYEAHKWLVEDDRLRQSRMCLILAARQVLKNGLGLLDVSAPEVL